MCFSKGEILRKFEIKICLIKRSTEVIQPSDRTFCRTLVKDIIILCAGSKGSTLLNIHEQ